MGVPFHNPYLIWISFYPSLGHHKSEKFVGTKPKGTLERIKAHHVLPDEVKGFFEMSTMIKPDDALYHSIIYAHLSSVPNNSLKYIVYKPLIGGASVL